MKSAHNRYSYELTLFTNCERVIPLDARSGYIEEDGTAADW